MSERVKDESVFRSNSFIMGSLRKMALDQPVSDRMHYVDSAIEAMIDQPTSGRLIQSMYKEIMSMADIDFGKVPDSKGDLTKYAYYSQLVKCIEILNNLAKNTPNSDTSTITTMNNFHNVLLDARDDFVFGYRFGVDLLKHIYQINVLVLHELVNACIIEVTDALKTAASGTNTPIMGNARSRSNLFVDIANNFINIYNKGDWATFMKAYRKNSSNLFGTRGEVFIAEVIGNSTLIAGSLAIPGLRWVAIVVGVFIVARIATRAFYAAKYKMGDYAKYQAELIKANMAAEYASGDDTTKQTELVERLEDLSAKLLGKYNKTERKATADIKVSNAQNYNKTELNNAETFSGLDFELV